MAKKKVVTKKPSPAKASVNKSQIVRDYAAKHPTAKPKAIAAALKSESGIDISPQQISTVLFNARKKSGAKRSKRVATGSPAADRVSLSGLLDAKAFAEKVGGVDDAVTLLKSLEKLGG